MTELKNRYPEGSEGWMIAMARDWNLRAEPRMMITTEKAEKDSEDDLRVPEKETPEIVTLPVNEIGADRFLQKQYRAWNTRCE